MKTDQALQERIRRAENDLQSAERKRQRIEQAILSRRKALSRLRSLLPLKQDASCPPENEKR